MDKPASPTVNGNEVTKAPPPAAVSPPAARKRNFGWLWLLLLGALAYGGYRFYTRTNQKQPPSASEKSSKMASRPVPIVAQPARIGDIPVYLRGLGSVTAFNNVAVKSRVEGMYIAVHFQEGLMFTNGQLL